MAYAFSVQISVSEEYHHFADILTVAVEGGIQYWANVLAYKHECQPSETFAKIWEFDPHDSDEEVIKHTLTIDRIASAIGIMLRDPECFVPSAEDNAQKLALAILTDADPDYDAGDADCMVQLGLFGEVIYG